MLTSNDIFDGQTISFAKDADWPNITAHWQDDFYDEVFTITNTQNGYFELTPALWEVVPDPSFRGFSAIGIGSPIAEKMEVYSPEFQVGDKAKCALRDIFVNNVAGKKVFLYGVVGTITNLDPEGPNEVSWEPDNVDEYGPPQARGFSTRSWVIPKNGLMKIVKKVIGDSNCPHCGTMGYYAGFFSAECANSKCIINA